MGELYNILKAANFSGSGDDGSAYAHSLELSINSQTYVMTATLKNTSGEALGTPQTIDLPLETMVVGGSYDDNTKKVILTLKNGNTVDFSVADLVDGLQSEITSTNKLNSDLVDDTNQNNKFVTSAEKTKIANALTEEIYNAGKTIPAGTTYVVDGVTYTVENNAEVFNNYTANIVASGYSHAEGNHAYALGGNSHAEGGYTKATALSAHSEGGDTTASGVYSHAEGRYSVASGARSHAEGDTATASAWGSHAEGGYTKAINDNAHAEGRSTTASGDRSHAEGSYTTASGNMSHAEGDNTAASGRCSHVEGANTIASSACQHVQGKNNIEDSNGKYAFIIGNGASPDARSNAFAVDWEGKIYVNNSATGVDVSDLLARIIALENKVAALENA